MTNYGMVGQTMMRYILSILLASVIGPTIGQNLKLELIRSFVGHSHGVRHVVFSPDGSSFASGGTRGEVFIWSIDGNHALKKLKGHFGSITDMSYSEDGNLLVSAGEDRQVKVWDANTGYELQRILSPQGETSQVNKVNFCIVSSKSGTVYFGGANRFICKAAVKGDGRAEVIYKDPDNDIRCAVLSPNGRELIFASGKYLMAFDLTKEVVVREYNTGSCQVNSLKFSRDGKRLLTWCENSRVDMRDPANFYLITSFRSGSGGRQFSNLAFTEDQKYVVTGDHASRFNVWDLENKQKVLDQGAEQGTILSFDLESATNYLLSGSLDKSIKLWRIIDDVAEEPRSTRKKNQQSPETVVTPEVEIVHYSEPVEDVPQLDDSTHSAVQPTLPEAVTETYEPASPKELVQSQLPERFNNRRVKPLRQEQKLTLSSHQLTLEIWDAQVVDGDIVSIYINNECIVKEYSITATKKTVHFDASAYSRVYVFLHALNLGTIPPNTVTMTVSDGIQTKEIQMRSDMTGSAAVELNFQDEVSE